MRIAIPELKPHLKVLDKIIERKAMLPVLSCCFINSVSISGTDLDVTYKGFLHGFTYAGDRQYYILPYGALRHVVQHGAGDYLDIENNAKSVVLSRGDLRLTASLMSTSAADFPSGGANKKASLLGNVNLAAMRRALRFTEFCVTHEQSRFTLAGENLLLGETMEFQATDGHRLAVYKERNELDAPAAAQSLLGLRGLQCLHEVKGDGAQLSCWSDGEGMRFTGADWQLDISNLKGVFPHVQAVLERTPTEHFITLDASSLLKACRAALLFTDRVQIMVLAAPKSAAQCTASFRSPWNAERSGGEYDSQISVITYTAATADLSVALNPRYVLDFLRAMPKDAQHVTLRFTPESGRVREPVELSCAASNDYEYRYIVMPLAA